jgi:uncharacterized membrane protein
VTGTGALTPAASHQTAPAATLRRRQRFRFFLERLRGEYWLIPALFAFGAIGLAQLITSLEDGLADGTHTALLFRGTASSGQQVLSTIATSVLSLAALVFSISMVVLQLTSQQFSPRALRTFNRDPRTQAVLGVFVATFLYALLALGSLGEDVGSDEVTDLLSVTVGIGLALLSLAAFLFLVHHLSQSIRVAHIIEAITNETRQCIAENFPETRPALAADAVPPHRRPDHVVTFDHRSGVVTSVRFDDLAELARRHDCVLRLVPEVGEYVPRGTPLLHVWGDRPPPAVKVLRLTGIEIERSVELDVAFGFRQLVDIAEKALSPAINDPTTAVQVIDRITDLLGRLSTRQLPRGVVLDRAGDARLFYEPIAWDPLVHLAFDELRDYGAGSRQVARRLRAALLVLAEHAPPERRRALLEQLEALDRAIIRHWGDSSDLAEAAIADDLGLGGET